MTFAYHRLGPTDYNQGLYLKDVYIIYRHNMILLSAGIFHGRFQFQLSCETEKETIAVTHPISIE